MSDDNPNDDNSPNPTLQPGVVINPGAVPSPPPAPSAPPPITVPEKPAPAAPEEPEPEEEAANEPEPAESSASAISWTASEFIAHDKSVGWYLKLAVAAIVFSAFIFLITRDFVSMAAIILAALILGIYGARKPRQLQYSLDESGLTIGAKRYSYEGFKSFSIVSEGAFSNISFMPLKRFASIITVYYSPKDEEKIMNALSARLPYEEPRRDAIDSLMRRIRF